MKHFVYGVISTIVLAIIGYYYFNFAQIFPAKDKVATSPSPSASASPSPSPVAKSQPAELDTYPHTPTTKGGLPLTQKTPAVKGASTAHPSSSPKPKITTLLLESSVCPVSIIKEVTDLKLPYLLKYELKNNTALGITAWRRDGNEVILNTTYSGNQGTIFKVLPPIDYLKIRIESKVCTDNNDNWIKLYLEQY